MQGATLSVLAAGSVARISRAAEVQPAEYLIGQVVDQPPLRMSDFKLREPFGWHVAGLPPAGQDGQVIIQWPADPNETRPARMRLCLMDTRESRKLIEATLAKSGALLGQFDVRCAAQFQLYEIKLSADQAKAARREGVLLRQVEGKNNVWFLTGAAGDSGGPDVPDALHPHLLYDAPTDPMREYFKRMNSLASIQNFGWMEGCVLDGLRDLSQLADHAEMRRGLNAHLDLFFKPDGRLVAETSRMQPMDDRLNTIEATGPIAALAWERPDHAALDLAIKFWRSRNDDEDCVIDGGYTTTEGAYTIGYPMAVIARQRDDKQLAEWALKQVVVRQRRLFDGKMLQRVARRKKDGSIDHAEPGWCRGTAWQMIGLARTCRALGDMVDTSEARRGLADLARWVAPYQLPGGLWSVFVDKPELTPDTAGSSGIAASIAIGINQGWVDPALREVPRKTLAGAKAHLTPDGYLGGGAQSNKGGRALQVSDYRVLYPMGMGLMAQLYAALQA